LINHQSIIILGASQNSVLKPPQTVFWGGPETGEFAQTPQTVILGLETGEFRSTPETGEFAPKVYFGGFPEFGAQTPPNCILRVSRNWRIRSNPQTVFWGGPETGEFGQPPKLYFEGSCEFRLKPPNCILRGPQKPANFGEFKPRLRASHDFSGLEI
jgi:hypothetical protein